MFLLEKCLFYLELLNFKHKRQHLKLRNLGLFYARKDARVRIR